jgi:hypothetical protein
MYIYVCVCVCKHTSVSDRLPYVTFPTLFIFTCKEALNPNKLYLQNVKTLMWTALNWLGTQSTAWPSRENFPAQDRFWRKQILSPKYLNDVIIRTTLNFTRLTALSECFQRAGHTPALHCTWEVTGSNFGQVTTYQDWIVCGFPQSLQANTGMSS